MGTPEWALPSLRALLEDGCEVAGVFTQPDRPVGRKLRLQPSPVKLLAEGEGITVYTPQKAGSPEGLELLSVLVPDLIVVCAYGQLLPQALLGLPSKGCFNLHFSLLPRWRGASPVQAAILAGDKQTGVSLQKMVLRLDAGPVVAESTPEPIMPTDTSLSLGPRLAEIGRELLRNTLPALFTGNYTLREQSEKDATYCRTIKKSEGQIDWHQETAEDLERKLRAFTPWPGIYCFDEKGRRLQITKAMVQAGTYEPGKVGPDLSIGTKQGALRVLSIKAEGKRETDAQAYLRGNAHLPGSLLR